MHNATPEPCEPAGVQCAHQSAHDGAVLLLHLTASMQDIVRACNAMLPAWQYARSDLVTVELMRLSAAGGRCVAVVDTGCLKSGPAGAV
jgi:hypothetical protein